VLRVAIGFAVIDSCAHIYLLDGLLLNRSLRTDGRPITSGSIAGFSRFSDRFRINRFGFVFKTIFTDSVFKFLSPAFTATKAVVFDVRLTNRWVIPAIAIPIERKYNSITIIALFCSSLYSAIDLKVKSNVNLCQVFVALSLL